MHLSGVHCTYSKLVLVTLILFGNEKFLNQPCVANWVGGVSASCAVVSLAHVNQLPLLGCSNSLLVSSLARVRSAVASFQTCPFNRWKYG